MLLWVPLEMMWWRQSCSQAGRMDPEPPKSMPMMGLCLPSLCHALGARNAPLTRRAAREVQTMSVCLPCCYSWHRAPEPVPRALGVRGLRLPAPSPACGSAGLLQPTACCWFQLCGFLLRLAWSHGAGWSCAFDLPCMEAAAQPEQLAVEKASRPPCDLRAGLGQGRAVSGSRRGSGAVQPRQSAHFAFHRAHIT